jgi:hypothetical protein
VVVETAALEMTIATRFGCFALTGFTSLRLMA